MLPWFALIWSLSYLVFFRTMQEQRGPLDNNQENIFIPLATLILVCIFILFPVRTLIMKCIEERDVEEAKYEDHDDKFVTDYDRENPITKKEGEVRFLNELLKKASADKDFSESEKKGI